MFKADPRFRKAAHAAGLPQPEGTKQLTEGDGDEQLPVVTQHVYAGDALSGVSGMHYFV